VLKQYVIFAFTLTTAQRVTGAVWREAGVDDFVHVRVNNYDVNRALLERVGVLNANPSK